MPLPSPTIAVPLTATPSTPVPPNAEHRTAARRTAKRPTVGRARSGRRRRITVAATIGGLVIASGVTPVRAADDPCGERAQTRAAPTLTEARRLLNLTYTAFAAAASAPDRTAGFDWTTDGCSWTPVGWRRRFEPACRLHDFGYRNLGNGLRLSRDGVTRKQIDVRFLTEMRRICDDAYRGWRYEPGRRGCRTQALLMYEAVRSFNDWSD